MRSLRILALPLPLSLALGLGVPGAGANPLLQHFHGQPHSGGGGGGGGGGTAYALDAGSGVRADFSNGQAFITWPDVATGSPGNDYRYWVYRSTSPITSGNYSGLTPFASYVFNNSGQLFGGNPDVAGGSTFTQAHRQANDTTNPMSLVPDANLGGTRTLAYGTGLQVYTATGTATAYYAVVAASCPAGVCPGSPTMTYIGSVGPIAESVATPQPIQYAHRTTGYGRITGSTSGLPMIFNAHASSSGGGTAAGGNSVSGDYWEQWLTPAEGWQDGRATAVSAIEDGVSGHTWPSLTNAIVLRDRDTIWTPDGLGAMETNHFGVGMTPNPLVGPANRLYRSTSNMIKRQVLWAISQYGLNANALHWDGQSMGAWGGARTGLRMTSPQFASLWLRMPIWRFDYSGSPGTTYWAGETWSSTMPFKATTAAAPNTLGATASSILLDDGTVWGGDGNYADTPALVQASPGTDLAVVMWSTQKDEGFIGSPPTAGFKEHVAMAAALNTAHRGFGFAWTMGGHADTSPFGALDCDNGSGVGVDANCYGKALFRLDLPYVALSNSSINDNPGTGTRNASGIYDGDPTGCMNCGFSWSTIAETSGGVSFTLSNGWLNRSPTPTPTTTLTGTIASSGGGSVTVTDGTVFQTPTTTKGTYFVVGGTEIVSVSGVSGNTVTFTGRSQLGTTAQAHSAGETITQYIPQPTGPNGGPYLDMTVDAALRRLQTWRPAGAISCTATPAGGSPAAISGATVTAGIPILPAIPIHYTGATSVSCSG